jgi:hypothetical protein
MSRRLCESCGAFNPIENECRRESPKPIPIVAGNSMQLRAGYPPTTKSHWCAQWIDPRMLEAPPEGVQ